MKTRSIIITFLMAMPLVIQGAEPRLVGPVNSSHDEGGAEFSADYHTKVVALFLTARRHAGKTFANKTQYNAAVAGIAKDLQRADAAWEKLRKNVELIEESAR